MLPTAPPPMIGARVALVALVGAGRLVVGDAVSWSTGNEADAARVAARNERVLANQGLVDLVLRRHRRSRIDRDDLVQRGNLGLILAADKYDPNMGYAFGTFAVDWIRQHVRREREKMSRAVRVPYTAGEFLRRYYKVERRLIAAGDDAPATDDVLDAMGVRASRRPALREVVAAARAGVVHADWDFATTDERDGSVPGAGTSLDRLESALAWLDDRSRFVLDRHYGLDGRPPATLRAIAAELAISNSRVGQIHERALDCLRERLRDGA